MDDEFLYKYIPAAEKSAMDAIPKEDELNHTFSKKFQRKMKALVDYERRGTFGRAAVRFGRAAAAVLLIVFLLNTVLVVGVAAYREKFFEMIQTVTEKYTAFTVDVDDDAPVTELIPIQPPYIPEGFELVEQFNDAINYDLVYQDLEGREIYYSQSVVTTSAVHIDTEDAAVQQILIGDCMVYVVVEDGTTQLHWFDGDYRFLVIGNADYESILAVAEGIVRK